MAGGATAICLQSRTQAEREQTAKVAQARPLKESYRRRNYCTPESK